MKEFRTKLLLMAAVAATSLVMHTLYTRYQQRRVMQYGPVLPNS